MRTNYTIRNSQLPFTDFSAIHTCKLLIAEEDCSIFLRVSIQLMTTPLHCNFCSILTAYSESCCVETHYKEFTAVFHNFPATHTCSLLIAEEDCSTFFRASIQFIIKPLHCNFCSNSAYSEVCCVNTHYKEFRAVLYNFVATHTCKLLIAEEYCPTLLIVSVQLIITPLHLSFLFNFSL